MFTIIGALFLSQTRRRIANTCRELDIPAAISLPHTFLPEGVVLGFGNFAWGHKKNKILCEETKLL